MTSLAHTHRSRWWQRLFKRIAWSRPGGWIVLNITTRIDPPLMRLTGGRVHSGLLIGVPLALLTTTGARTGRERTVPLLVIMDGERMALIASQTGRPDHPAWYYNLRANPPYRGRQQVTLTLRGRARACVARDAVGPERERLWAMALDIYPGYDVYQARAGRRIIPVVVLEPQEDQL
jgi:deazaflavin-dependent oxidoreductase (nitroreductase family)